LRLEVRTRNKKEKKTKEKGDGGRLSTGVNLHQEGEREVKRNDTNTEEIVGKRGVQRLIQVD